MLSSPDPKLPKYPTQQQQPKLKKSENTDSKKKPSSPTEIPIKVMSGQSQGPDLQTSEPSPIPARRNHNQHHQKEAQPAVVVPVGSGEVNSEQLQPEKNTTRERKLSIGQRLISSLSSKSSFKNLTSKSATSLHSHSNSSLKFASFSKKNDNQKQQQQQQQQQQQTNPNIGDIDFRKSRTSIVDDNLLIDGHTIYPMVVHQKPPIAVKNALSTSQILHR